MVEKEFYERMYGQGSTPPVKASTLSRLKRKITLDRLEASNRLLEQGERFLDLGCGAGILVLKSSAKYKYCYGIDFVSSLLAAATRESVTRGESERIKFLEANINQPLPFPESYFDAVACTSVLAHVFEPLALVKETKRILKKNGILIIQVPNLGYIKYRLAVLFGKLPEQSTQMGWNGGILHYFTSQTLCKLLESENFRIEKKTCSGTLIGLRRLWLPLLGADIILKTRKI